MYRGYEYGEAVKVSLLRNVIYVMEQPCLALKVLSHVTNVKRMVSID
jgi:hypothetical protein